jgi:hypothetical protein
MRSKPPNSTMWFDVCVVVILILFVGLEVVIYRSLNGPSDNELRRMGGKYLHYLRDPRPEDLLRMRQNK